MIPIKYITGDATEPQGEGRKIIAHICNDVGAWGAGFVLALSARSSAPERGYQRWFLEQKTLPRALDVEPPFELGEIQFTAYDSSTALRPDVFVCNMIAQKGCGPAKCSHCAGLGQHDDHGDCIHCRGTGRIPPFRDWALRYCLRKLAPKAHAAQATVHMPRIGCGLGGGTWEKITPIILQEVSAHNIAVTVYDLPMRTCMLTGAEGENPDDCTTHQHEMSNCEAARSRPVPTITWQPAALG